MVFLVLFRCGLKQRMALVAHPEDNGGLAALIAVHQVFQEGPFGYGNGFDFVHGGHSPSAAFLTFSGYHFAPPE